jgi:hypothetical protein
MLRFSCILRRAETGAEILQTYSVIFTFNAATLGQSRLAPFAGKIISANTFIAEMNIITAAAVQARVVLAEVGHFCCCLGQYR